MLLNGADSWYGPQGGRIYCVVIERYSALNYRSLRIFAFE